MTLKVLSGLSLLVLVLAGGAPAVDDAAAVLRQPDEPPENFAIVVLYLPQSDKHHHYSNYRGWVLVPGKDPGSYHKESLPPLEDSEGDNEYEVKSVFTADADGDSVRELCVLATVYRNGTGSEEYYGTEVYKWNGKAFVHTNPAIRNRLLNLRTAAAVRARLKKGAH
jgi:hypothetical protein